MVGLGVVVRRQRYGDHGGVGEPVRRRDARAQQAHGRQGGRAVADQGDEHHSAVDLGEAGDLVLVERIGHRHEGRARV